MPDEYVFLEGEYGLEKEEIALAINCPFYGYNMALGRSTAQRPDFAPFRLIPTRGNQCALITGAHSPCQLETTGQPIEWSVCPFVVGRLIVGGK